VRQTAGQPGSALASRTRGFAVALAVLAQAGPRKRACRQSWRRLLRTRPLPGGCMLCRPEPRIAGDRPPIHARR